MSATTREQILRSAIRAIAERGYEATTVDELLEHADLARVAFEQEFDDKEVCVLAAYDWVIDGAVARFAEAYETGMATSWPEAVRRGLEALLAAIAEHPAATRVATVEVPAVGPEAHRRYRAAMERFLPYLRDGRDFCERPEELPDHVDLMALGAAEAIIFDEIAGGRAEGLPAMMPEILFTVLVPYLGPQDAAGEMHAAAAPTG